MPRVAMPMARPMMSASASGELNTRSLPKARCRPCVTLKTPALAGDRLERRLAAAVGHVLAEHDDPRVARHFVLQRAVDRGDHRVGLAVGHGVGAERGRRRIDVGRVDEQAERCRATVSRRAIARSAAAFTSASTSRDDLPGARLRVAMPSRRQEKPRAAQSDRASLRRRAPPPSCTASRRPRASASTGRITLACTSAGPLRARA